MASWAPAYDQGVANVDQNDYCIKQVQEFGMDPQVCAARFQMYRARTQGKGAKAYGRWARGKGASY